MLSLDIGNNEWIFDAAIATAACLIYFVLARLFFPNEKERAYILSVSSSGLIASYLSLLIIGFLV